MHLFSLALCMGERRGALPTAQHPVAKEELITIVEESEFTRTYLGR